MAWITITAAAGGYLAALNSSVAKVEQFVGVTKGLIGTYIYPFGWNGDNMIPPITRVNVMQTDTRFVTEYRGLTKASAKAAAQDSSTNKITIDGVGRITQTIAAEAARANEADGWSVVITIVNSSYSTQEIVL